jgi:RNA polymerase sigma factor (TIGR02999 family)
LEEVTPRVYLELRRMAARYMRHESDGYSLPATALVHEVFLRLVEVDGVSWQDRAHLFAVSANMMPRILVDQARAKGMAKRGGAALHMNLDDIPEIASGSRSRKIVAVDEALDALAQIDPRQGKGHRALVFRRAQRRGNGRSTEDLCPECHARLEDGQLGFWPSCAWSELVLANGMGSSFGADRRDWFP